jgi:hypothetical protein
MARQGRALADCTVRGAGPGHGPGEDHRRLCTAVVSDRADLSGALLFHSARRVPALAPEHLRFRLDSATLREVALRPGRIWCLPGDPDAGHPDAVPISDEAELGKVLRDQVIAHASRFLAVYGPQVCFGRRTKWATVTDVLDSGLLLAGRAFGSPQAGAADARLVLGSGEDSANPSPDKPPINL